MRIGLRRAANEGGVALIATLVIASSTVSAAASIDRPAGSGKIHGNNFFSNCRFSHTAPDDPIVSPQHPGVSHPHTFFGNRTTDAFSTLASLRRARTTCRPRSDTAAYWVPTLYQGGREIRPGKAQIYYVLTARKEIHPFPAGLRMVAGNAGARRPQSERVTWWACGGRAFTSGPSTRAPARCPTVETAFHERAQTFLELHVIFPDCWDGKHLDSTNHRSHMAYSRQRICPASHPVKVPLLRLLIRYPITSGKSISLASGGEYSGHADFFNAWNQRALARLVDACFHLGPCNR